ncbi:FecR domain-containing protein [Parabacteroides sp. OttesenSCG-928-G06]|nr:FecR domain-containing protein [Parabacteroides sp. OttesenSCG-928-K15]MDL2281931.1 FecR domain-containing protein [Parabacteroides sp. OttesenSCG-928-G06]
MKNIDRLIIIYLSGDATSKEEADLLQWLEASEENRDYFRSLKDSFDMVRIKEDMQESRTQNQWQRFKQHQAYEPSVKRKQILIRFARYAAVFVLGIISFYVTFLLSDKGHETTEKEWVVETTVIETGAGDRSKVVLPDGSTVWINACSRLSYDNTFGKQNRKVSIEGEAFFEVKKDTEKPFLVETDKFTYRVTGTSFNVYSYEQEKESSIALLEGGVLIEYDNKQINLYPGEIITYDRTTENMKRENTDVNQLISWRYGEFVFEEMTFADLSKRSTKEYVLQTVKGF